MAEKAAAISSQNEYYLSEFDSFYGRESRHSPTWLNQIRTEGLSQFTRLGFPTTRQEDWRFTSVAPLLKHSFQLPSETESIEERILKEARFEGVAIELVFVNGKYDENLTLLSSLPEGVRAGSLKRAIVESPELVEQHLAKYATITDGFTALNTALLHDGAFVYIPDDVTMDRPVHFIFVTTSAGPVLSSPRNLFILGKHVTATLLETYHTAGSGVHLTIPVTETVVGEASRIDHLKMQIEAADAFHIASSLVTQHRNSYYESISISAGGRITRNSWNVVLDGEGAECVLDGLYMGSGEQHIDNQTLIDHAKPHCISHELYKGVLSGKSSAVFNGKVIVRKDAQGTDARQVNKNLLLSDGTHVNTKPQLEILADDVKCSHGATIGQLEEDAVFYLKTRGLSDRTARQLLTYGFARDVIDEIKDEALKKRLENLIAQKLLQQIAEVVP